MLCGFQPSHKSRSDLAVIKGGIILGKDHMMYEGDPLQGETWVLRSLLNIMWWQHLEQGCLCVCLCVRACVLMLTCIRGKKTPWFHQIRGLVFCFFWMYNFILCVGSASKGQLNLNASISHGPSWLNLFLLWLCKLEWLDFTLHCHFAMIFPMAP